MPNIDEFKASLLGGGARANQFRVTITEPTGIGVGLDIRKTSFLVSAASIPAMNIPNIAIPFRGRTINIAGDREFADAWTTTFYNDTDFMIRNAMERWSNGINDLATGTGVVNPSDYQSDLMVEHLDRDDTILKSYIFRSAWPEGVTEIALSSEASTAIETFDVTWRYQSYEASGVNF
tara:strand:+ start:225 stop:758 length:534 start_codon:yes stop_codon:yes gene_type:complete